MPQFVSKKTKSPLRVITCGSVDDGKSTLLGRLLYDSSHVFTDQLDIASEESKRYGTQGGNLDLALLIDGLQAEREQKITIDVAYRYFSTPSRSFIVADTPGHEQYTCNMGTGASTSDLAILLVDARNGIVPQTRRHSCIVDLLAIKHVVVAVNKMDLIDWQEDLFHSIENDFRTYAENLNFDDIHCIPISALNGANVFVKASETPWYAGSTLVDVLENIEVDKEAKNHPFRMPVQWINRPTLDFRGYSGTVASGSLSVGDEVVGCLTGQLAKVSSIYDTDQEIDNVQAGHAVTVELDRQIDLGRGDVMASAAEPPDVSDQFAAKLIWLNDEPMLPQRQYLMKTGTLTTTCRILELEHVLNIDTFAHEASHELRLNDIAYIKLATTRPIAYESYHTDRHLGSFILIDRITHQTVGAGMIDFSLRRASNITWQSFQINKEQRGLRLAQKPCILWLTGLSGAGKTTIAGKIEELLIQRGNHCYVLDGDNIRHGLNRDLGFTAADRVENIKRVAEVAKLFVDAGLIAIVSLISPFRNERQMARELVEHSEFIEIFVDTPLDVCEQRDPKGLYKKVRAGELSNFTGIDSPYESPENPELVLTTSGDSPLESATRVLDYLDENKYLHPA